ncbi:uncharacterized protein N0V89_007510 [Didymosphaeria variabile]|uniref:Uncharacterized protein n=1 Tax=Didymosphaeria variabile TaxID=1932322 RepID=A0A9W9CAC0_9PLEO|nr:uncharacterized protein N0V89_007510 [Didymosphaeria variabile]KAJ4352163.1 hypothetical protein N0V89_007510 [Didymosphaeria variabile]
MRSTLILATFVLPILTAPVPEADGSVCLTHPDLDCSSEAPSPSGVGTGPICLKQYAYVCSNADKAGNGKRQPEPPSQADIETRFSEPNVRKKNFRFPNYWQDGRSDLNGNGKRQPEPFDRAGSGRRRSAEPERVRYQTQGAETFPAELEPSVNNAPSAEIQDEDSDALEALEARSAHANHHGRSAAPEPSIRGPRTGSNKRTAEDEDEDTETLGARWQRDGSESGGIKKRSAEPEPINRRPDSRREPEPEPRV